MNRVTTSAMAGEVTGHAGGVASPSLGHLRAAQAWWSFIALSSPLSAIMQSSDGRLLFLTLAISAPPPHPTPPLSSTQLPTPRWPPGQQVLSIHLPFQPYKAPVTCCAWPQPPGGESHYCGDVSETCSNSGCNYCLRTVVSASLSHNQLFTCHVTVRNLKTSGRHCNC